MQATRARQKKRKKPDKRHDPRSRKLVGAEGWTEIKNKDPNRKYVWVDANNKDKGPDYYYAIGYEFETLRKDGPKPINGRTVENEGERITMMGNNLMSIDVESWDYIQEFGEGGNTGQAMWDELEQKIVSRREGLDPLRGIREKGREVGFGLVNDTTEIK